jgi:hypothetical protein
MIIEIHGCKSAIQQCLLHIEQLPKGFRPLYFSENEVGVDKVQKRCSDTVKFEEFKSENPLGYFLHSESCMIDVSFDEDRSSVFFDVKKKKAIVDIPKLMESFSVNGIHYGMACDWEEWRYRNGLAKTIGNSTIENWVGRDYREYLPGLYWLNLIPKTLFNHLGIKQEKIVDAAYCFQTLDNNFLLLKMFELPQNWQDHASDLDDLCEQENGIFSKWDIWDELQSIDDQKAYLLECQKYP